jgi:hypothetical protein
MIAVVSLTYAGQPYVASLDDGGRWSCAQEDLQSMLNSLYSPLHEEQGPALGAYGMRQVQEAIDRFAGKVLWEYPEDTTETIY